MATRYSFFALLKATPAWLALPRSERNRFNSEELGALFARFPQVGVRMYDCEAFTGRYSNIVVFETEEVHAYHLLIDSLRDSRVFSVPYFEFVDIVPAIEEHPVPRS
ncbi:darcynin family protein [Parachitinimonas caeni]|uniref:Darcynin 1 n=1 Tax=Parachitinimonas caeni TaxID=3031301 RepID=A0ABT7DX13_9NEIS|nr:darcynin family protein [Parachitinimonas caeni]MDK2124603.1 hypothetical protein [Parachitinimonas caeni]